MDALKFHIVNFKAASGFFGEVVMDALKFRTVNFTAASWFFGEVVMDALKFRIVNFKAASGYFREVANQTRLPKYVILDNARWIQNWGERFLMIAA